MFNKVNSLDSLPQEFKDALKSVDDMSEADLLKFCNLITTALKKGVLLAKKQKAYGDSFTKAAGIIKLFIAHTKNSDGDYVLSEELLDHLLIMVRIIDKQNRIFNNPKGDLMGESPYGDIAGYSLLQENKYSAMAK